MSTYFSWSRRAPPEPPQPTRRDSHHDISDSLSSYEGADESWCLQPGPLPRLCASSNPVVSTPDTGSDDEGMMRSLLRWLYDTHARVEALAAARFQRISASDSELFRLCPCGRGVSLTDLFVAPREGDGSGDPAAPESTPVSDSDAAKRLAAHKQAMTDFITIGSLQRARILNIDQAFGVAQTLHLEDGVCGQLLSGMLREIVTRMEYLNAQISSQFVRIADFEAKLVHVAACVEGCSLSASRERDQYCGLLREGVRASESAVEELVEVRTALARDFAAGVASRENLERREMDAAQEAMETHIAETDEIQELMRQMNDSVNIGNDVEVSEEESEELDSDSSRSRAPTWSDDESAVLRVVDSPDASHPGLLTTDGSDRYVPVTDRHLSEDVRPTGSSHGHNVISEPTGTGPDDESEDFAELFRWVGPDT